MDDDVGEDCDYYNDDESYVIGDADDLSKVWMATKLLWVVVLEEDELVECGKEEDSWSEVLDFFRLLF